MTQKSMLAYAVDRREDLASDRRVLHRGDSGRRDGDEAPSKNTLPPAESGEAMEGSPVRYLAIFAALFIVLWAGVIFANYSLNPLLYSQSAAARVAEEWTAGNNYAVFDLNIETRALRREHLKRMPAAPEVTVIGASHWQEATAALLPDRDFYNAHIHRDYFEDILGMSEMFLVNDRLPKTMIISIRDLTFSDPATRTDYLWLPIQPDYRAMARRLGIEYNSWLDNFAIEHYLGLTSLPVAWAKAKERILAPQLPGPTNAEKSPTLDVLHAKGFITWSSAHKRLFTQQRTTEEVQRHFDSIKQKRISIDDAAVDAVNRVVGLLVERGVRVMFVHPPFNPEFYEKVITVPYGQDLQRVHETTKQIAANHGIPVFGSFDPRDVGCERTMFIDAEHSGPDCLGRVLAQAPGL